MATPLTGISPRVALTAYERMAVVWDLSAKESAILLGIGVRTFHRWFRERRLERMRSGTVERISHLMAIWEDLTAIFGQCELAHSWLKRENADFGARPPLERMLHGCVQDLVFVRDYLGRARQGW